MNKIMKEVYQLSNRNKINTKYKMKLCIPHTYIIVMDFYNRDHFIQYVLQVTRFDFNRYFNRYRIL